MRNATRLVFTLLFSYSQAEDDTETTDNVRWKKTFPIMNVGVTMKSRETEKKQK